LASFFRFSTFFGIFYFLPGHSLLWQPCVCVCASRFDCTVAGRSKSQLTRPSTGCCRGWKRTKNGTKADCTWSLWLGCGGKVGGSQGDTLRKLP